MDEYIRIENKLSLMRNKERAKINSFLCHSGNIFNNRFHETFNQVNMECTNVNSSIHEKLLEYYY